MLVALFLKKKGYAIYTKKGYTIYIYIVVTNVLMLVTVQLL